MGRGRPKKIEATWPHKEKSDRKSITEMGFAPPNSVGIRPHIGNDKTRTLYDPAMMPPQAFLLCAQHGATLEEMGLVWGVAHSTVSNWIEKHPEFAEAIRHGRDAFNVGQIEKSLVKRALGYEYVETTVKEIQYKVKGKEGATIVPATETTKITKHVPPSDVAIIFYLKNRNPERWKDRQEVLSVYGNIGDLKTKLSNCSVSDLKTLRDAVKSSTSEEEPDPTRRLN